MNKKVIFIIIIVIAVAAGAYWYMNNGLTLPSPTVVPVVAPVVTPVPPPIPSTPSVEPEEEMMAEEAPEPMGSHPFVGDKFLVTSKNPSVVIVPIENANEHNFKLDNSGARTEDMAVTLEAVEGRANTYFIMSKGLGKYIKYSNNGFGYRSSKPTTYHYKIKFTKVGENYVMSYTNSDDKEYFFGYDGDKMKSDESVTSLIGTGLVNVVDAGVSGYVLPGNFGSDGDNFREYGPGEDGDQIENVQGCMSRLSEVDLDDEYRSSLLSVAFNKDADTPCRAYPQSDSYAYDKDATGWVTTCLDGSKSIKQGCLL
jgi:hypothetical protein